MGVSIPLPADCEPTALPSELIPLTDLKNKQKKRKEKKCIRRESNPRQQSWLRPERSALTARPRMLACLLYLNLTQERKINRDSMQNIALDI